MAFISAANTVINNNTAIFHTSFEAIAGTTQSTEVKIKASDGASSDNFGRSVAVGSGRIVVGSPYDEDLLTNAGSAYIFNLNGTQIAKILPSDPSSFDNFGISVAVGSGRIVVGAPSNESGPDEVGAAYIFNLNGTQIAKIRASDPAPFDGFGLSVAAGCGRIVVGSYSDDIGAATNQGSAHIYDLNGNHLFKITASDGTMDDIFGAAVAIGCGRIVVGAYQDGSPVNSGSVYIFDLAGNQIAKIKASDATGGEYFGGVVAVGSGRIVVGAWLDNDLGTNSGSAYIFDLNGTRLAKIKASDGVAQDLFGRSVAVGSGRIVVGSLFDDDRGTDSGSVYIFDLNGNQLTKITASDGVALDEYGISVAAGCGRIVVGSEDDDDLGTASGSAYIYKLPETHDIYYENVLDTFRY